ncbi:MAG: hypothetical protein JWM83_2906 [Candidatus Angelobacter sp.]|nr:hypothetical protein [Candidatus Angelobacter sp.]
MKIRSLAAMTVLCAMVVLAPVLGARQKQKPAAPAKRPVPAAATATPKPTPPPINPVVTNCNITAPDAPINSSLLSSGLPCTLSAVPPFDLDNLQHAFDFNSWLTFLALNAPAAGGVIGNDAPTIWQKWAEVEDVFLPHGQAPRPWGSPPIRPAVCPKGTNMPILRMVGKTPNVLSTVIQPFNTGPLIDQNGQYVHYEIVINQPMFEYIVQNHLYSQEGQTSFPGPTEFPEGTLSQGQTGTIGAIVVKASWKVLNLKTEKASDFHSAKVLIYIPPQDNPKIQEKCYAATVGLVGLHIVHRTDGEPQWIWATFEHVDNDPTEAAVKANQLQGHYNFFNPKCADCAVNHQPPRPWNPNIVPFPKGYTSQIVRLIDLTDEAKKLNAAFQEILPNTVWQHYMLVSTQWPTNAKSKIDPNGVPAPTFLGNSTLETYIQGTVPQSSSSCMACHGNATDTTGRPSNFTYVLERAQSTK